jgi:uncharacterized membrane protein
MIERRTGISRVLSKVGELRWRVLMLLVTLSILFVPLTTALRQLRREAIAREAISQAVQMITPREGIITQNTSIPAEPNPIVVRLIVADPVEDQKVEEAERHIMRVTAVKCGCESAALRTKRSW